MWHGWWFLLRRYLPSGAKSKAQLKKNVDFLHLPYKLSSLVATSTFRSPRRRIKGKLSTAIRAPLHANDPARPAQLREANCRTLLRLLRANSPCSKADLVRGSGLSATTVSASVGRMSELGLVEALGDGESSGGRPPGLLRFNGGHALVAAADIGGTRLRMMLADLNGRPITQWAVQLNERQKTPRAVVALLGQGLSEMLRQSGATTRVMHIVIGAPGITDVKHGVILAAPNLQGWTDLPLRMLVERELHVNATIENDTNLAAVGEHAEGAAKGIDDFVFVAMGTGVGAGIFLQGALHHGASWSAGEIGYLPVSGLARQPMRLQETGQLEQTIGGAGIEAMWQKLLRNKRNGRTSVLLPLRAPQIFDLAEEGHALAGEVLNSVARILADAVATIALLMNPQMVVLGGGVGSHRALCRATDALLQQSEFAQPVLRSSPLGTEAQLFGAISVALAAADVDLLC